MPGPHLCSTAGCGLLLGSMGIFDLEGGHKCGLCEVREKHELLFWKHAAQLNMLASGRSSSRLLSLVRGDGPIQQAVAAVFAGTLEAAIQKYKVRVLSWNVRRLLIGPLYGTPWHSLVPPSLFVRLNRAWHHNTTESCLGLVMDFRSPWPCPAWGELRV